MRIRISRAVLTKQRYTGVEYIPERKLQPWQVWICGHISAFCLDQVSADRILSQLRESPQQTNATERKERKASPQDMSLLPSDHIFAGKRGRHPSHE